MTDPEIDAIALARDLIRCPSVTPVDAGALDVLADTLRRLGFTCHDLRFGTPGTDPVRNLYARLGEGGPHFCFAGHTDVVPVGAGDAWTVDPFAATVDDGMLYGRGAADMKGSIAAFAAATARFLAARGADFGGSISFLITGDEEGPAVNGTARMLDWLAARAETIDHCLVGEPTNPKALGDMIKIGRRGSLSGRLVVRGVAGHVAYPALADNPIPRLVAMLAAIIEHRFDDGTDHFQPTNLEVTTIDVGNTTGNVIPAEAVAQFNIRFNDLHQAADLERWLRATLDDVGGAYSLDVTVSGDAFLTAPGRFTDLVAGAVEKITGRKPELSTSGGTSDARFIKNVCPVCEFGLVGQTMHKADERIDLAALGQLTDIYAAVLDGYFPAGA